MGIIVAVEIPAKADGVDQAPNASGQREHSANGGRRPIKARHTHHKDQTRHSQSDIDEQKILLEQLPAAPVKAHHRPQQERRPVEAGLLPGVDLLKLGQIVIGVLAHQRGQRVAGRLRVILRGLGRRRHGRAGRRCRPRLSSRFRYRLCGFGFSCRIGRRDGGADGFFRLHLCATVRTEGSAGRDLITAFETEHGDSPFTYIVFCVPRERSYSRANRVDTD